jgi:hypothetical protein
MLLCRLSDEMPNPEPVDQSSEALRKGLALCREGEWSNGLFFLGKIAEAGRTAAMPGVFFTTLGYGIARYQQRAEEGLKLCRHGVKLQFYEPENYVYLARTALLCENRAEAVKAVRGGLKVDPNNAELQVLSKDLGIRQLPVLSFLSRSNPLNRLLGRLRARIFG